MTPNSTPKSTEILGLFLLSALLLIGFSGAALGVEAQGGNLPDQVESKVLPAKGWQSKIALGDSAVRLVRHGVIDLRKFEAIFRGRGAVPEALLEALGKPSPAPMLLTTDSASFYVNVLWPLGLANYMPSNKASPINGPMIFNFASTGGWNLGKEANGGAYFNKYRLVELTPEQEALVTAVAKDAYRPCCNNSTFFQDCNHGSALLGLLQLGAAQGLTEEELWREALAFNSFWFQRNYVRTALYFKTVKNLDWERVDARLVMGKDLSSSTGWRANVDNELNRLNLAPRPAKGSACTA